MKKYLLFTIAIFLLIPTAYAAEYPIYYGDASYDIKQNVLTLDSNNSGGDIILQFGATLAEKLFWDADGGDGAGTFDFTDGVTIDEVLGIGIQIPLSLIHVYEDTTNTDATAGVTVENNGTGDALLQLLLTGAQRWVVGIDNSDSDKFKIASSADLGTDTKLTIDTSGNTIIAGDIGLLEIPGNGQNYVGFSAPDSITTNKVWTLPSTDGTNGQVLKTNGSATLSWTDVLTAGTKKILIDAKQGLHEIDGVNNNCDTWTEYSYTDKEQYNEILGNAADQDVDIVYEAILPSDFSSWDTNAIQVTYKTSSATATTSGVSCTFYDTAGASAYVSSNVGSTTESVITATSTNLTDGSETWTPNGHFLIVCKGAVDTSAWVDIGKIIVSYNY